MPLVNNKVGNDATVCSDKASVDGKALVDSLIKVWLFDFDQHFFNGYQRLSIHTVIVNLLIFIID